MEWVKHAIEKQEHIKSLLESETDELKKMRLNEQYLEAREKVEKRLELREGLGSSFTRAKTVWNRG